MPERIATTTHNALTYIYVIPNYKTFLFYWHGFRMAFAFLVLANKRKMGYSLIFVLLYHTMWLSCYHYYYYRYVYPYFWLWENWGYHFFSPPWCVTFTHGSSHSYIFFTLVPWCHIHMNELCLLFFSYDIFLFRPSAW